MVVGSNQTVGVNLVNNKGRYGDLTDVQSLNNLEIGDFVIVEDITGYNTNTLFELSPELSDGDFDPNAADYMLVWDGSIWQIIDQDTGGSGITCPAPMTRSALLSLRNTGGLSKDCHYVITDYNRGTVGASIIQLHAVDLNTLGQSVLVKTGFDNTAWGGRYDIDTNRILELNDGIGNKVTGQEVVDTFPWGNTSVYDNIIEEGATFNYTDGNFFDNTIRTGAIVIVNNIGSGNFARNVIGEDSNVTWTAGDVRDNIIGTDAILNAGSTGDFDNNELQSFSRVDITGSGNADTNYIGQTSNLSVSAGFFNDNHLGTDSTFTSIGGTHYENTIEGSSIVTLTTTRNFYQNKISRNSTVVIGNHLVIASEFSATSVNTTGSSGNGIRYCKFLDSYSNTNMRNITTLYMFYCTVSNNSQISANDASRVQLGYLTLENFGRVLVSTNALLDSDYSTIADYGYIQVLQGRLYSRYSTIRGVSYIQHNSTGTNRVERVHVTTNSNIRFLGTSNNCRVYYSNISSGGTIYHNGGSTRCYFYYCDCTSSSQMYTQDSVNLRGYHLHASGNSQFYSIRVTATHYAYYCSMSGHGYVRMQDATGGRIYAVACSGQGLVRLLGSTAAGRIYYSSFHAYYYLYANNWTVTRTALHGYGRRTRTVTNPPSNGTYVENF